MATHIFLFVLAKYFSRSIQVNCATFISRRPYSARKIVPFPIHIPQNVQKVIFASHVNINA